MQEQKRPDAGLVVPAGAAGRAGGPGRSPRITARTRRSSATPAGRGSRRARSVLCDPDGRYITGQTIHANGGVFMG